MGFFLWLQETSVAIWIQESLWGYPSVLSTHAVGMAIVVGMVLMVNLRVLGFAGNIPLSAFERLFTVIWLGFLLNFISGALLFSADAVRFITSTVFLIKLSCIIAGGISMWVLVKLLMGEKNTGAANVIPGKARVIAAVSILLWVGAIIAGRLTAYID